MQTLTCTQTILKNIENNDFLKQFQVSPSRDYIYREFDLQEYKTKIIIYKNNTLSITGKYEKTFFNLFLDYANEVNYQGLDEVGVGDFFGPTVYVCVKLTQKALEKLKQIDVDIRDSKKINNDKIIEYGKKLANCVDYNYKIVYDKEIEHRLNSIEQKLYYHNQNLFEETSETIVDLFTTEKSFYNYSSKMNLIWPKNIILEEKADSKYLAVAIASIIARAIFLTEMCKIQKRYNKVKIPLGANVKKEVNEFVKVYGIEELEKFCKTSFKTFSEVKNGSN